MKVFNPQYTIYFIYEKIWNSLELLPFMKKLGILWNYYHFEKIDNIQYLYHLFLYYAKTYSNLVSW